jgi:hypothetical protein
MVILLLASGCSGFLIHQASGPTSNILTRAQPSLQMESDYELASRAIPGALKTIEGFYVADDKRDNLRALLAEGYCQYGTAFVEDEWEVAKFAGKLDEAKYHSQRASKMFARCMNYALADMPEGFEKDLFGQPEAAQKRIASIGHSDRRAAMWVAAGLGGMINHNLDRPDVVAYLPVVKQMLEQIVKIDAAHHPDDCTSTCLTHLALPHVALGMIYSAASKEFGGSSQKATEEFQKALSITGDKFLLARVLWAYRVGLQTNDRKLFHEQLSKVLETDPAIWPEQRLANEVAQRRARRYLSHEKELFQ